MRTYRLGVAGAVVDDQIVPGDVQIADGRVVAVGCTPAGRHGLCVPGLVDLQVNGFAGVDFLTADVEGYRVAGEALLRTGVTAYQPTFITAPEEVTIAALGAMRQVDGGPRIIGAHLEGPFISPGRLGVHPASDRRDPDTQLLDRLLGAAPVTMVTLAPELPGGLDMVTQLTRRGVCVSIGHSDATGAEAGSAFDRGASAVTHLFNAMRGLHHRDPGVAGTALIRDDVVVSLIADGHHVTDDVIRLVWRVAVGRIALVTDATAAAGMPDGRYRLGALAVTLEDGVVRDREGRLAGSALTMIDALRKTTALGIPLEAAVAAATSVPSRLVRRPDLGRLRPGSRADLLVLSDELELQATYLDGQPQAW